MILTTCYRLVLSSGADYNEPDDKGRLHTCKHLKRAFNVYGTPETVGLGTPATLSDILERVGLEAALWCLRCVHPEQTGAARRIARSLALDAALEGTELFPHDALYNEARARVHNHLDGRAELTDLLELRPMVWESIQGKMNARDNYGLATWISLGLHPERHALTAFQAGIYAALPDGATKEEIAIQTSEFREYMTTTLSTHLKSEEQSESGPGEVEEPTRKGRPVTNRRKLLMRFYGNASHESNDTLRQNLIQWGI